MKDDKIFRAIGNIDEDLIDRAMPMSYDDPKGHSSKRIVGPWYKRVALVAAGLIIILAIPIYKGGIRSGTTEGLDTGVTAPQLRTSEPQTEENGFGGLYDVNPSTSKIAPPSLSLDNEVESIACYTALENWRGLPIEPFVLSDAAYDRSVNRIVYKTLDELMAYADAFILVPKVQETKKDGEQMQTAIVEYAGTIGDVLHTFKWDDRTISTGSRVLIRQQLMVGGTMDEANNLLRKDGVYLLPVKFNPNWSAFEVLGDSDVLFELDNEGKIASHSIQQGFNQYDGKSLQELYDDIQALYPPLDDEFVEQPIHTSDQAKSQVIKAYNASGYRKFTVKYDKESNMDGVDVYLFKTSFGDYSSEYAAIAKENGAFMRGEMDSNGTLRTFGGLGSFPRDR